MQLGLFAKATPVEMCYGPWVDGIRSLMTQVFFPPDWADHIVFRRVVGKQRVQHKLTVSLSLPH